MIGLITLILAYIFKETPGISLVFFILQKEANVKGWTRSILKAVNNK